MFPSLFRRVWLQILFACAIACGCKPSTERADTVPVAPIATSGDRPVSDARITEFCGACHTVPRPEYFPRDAWFTEVKQGYDFYRTSGRSDLKPPPMQEVVSFYRALAPQELQLDRAPQNNSTSADMPFTKTSLDLPDNLVSPAVSHVSWRRTQPETLLFCEMQAGEIRELTFDGRRVAQNRIMANVDHPGHIEPCDLDGDGSQDWVVADLGTFQPADHDKGKVIWLRRRANSDNYEPIVLAGGLGRVADVQPGDFSGDGRLDLVVAEFGWRRSGRILLLICDGSRNDVPQYSTHVVDSRHGAIHVPTVDLNQDGKLDFVALISQEHEVIEAFVNRGDGTFDKRPVFQGADPAFGSSGIQVVDLDGDRDFDVLYTNGDTLDSHYLKPYHAIHWLENQGAFPFRHHPLATMPGVMRAVAADPDRDGDLDIFACAHIPTALLRAQQGGQFDSLIWLEQTERGSYVRRRIEELNNGHMTMDVGDFDSDGQIDLAVGCFANDVKSDSPWLEFWWGGKR